MPLCLAHLDELHRIAAKDHLFMLLRGLQPLKQSHRLGNPLAVVEEIGPQLAQPGMPREHAKLGVLPGILGGLNRRAVFGRAVPGIRP